MSVLNSLIFNGARGKIGGIIIQGGIGQTIAKQKAASVHNPDTLPQQQQRNTMKAVQALARLTSGSYQVGFTNRKYNNSAYNAFSSYNMLNGVTVNSPTDVVINPAASRFSNGSLGTTAMTSVTVDESDTNVVVVYPTTTPISGQQSTDVVYCVLHNVTDDTWAYLGSNATRAAGTATFTSTIPIAAADNTYVYIFFASADGSKSSISSTDTAVVQA